MAELAKKLHFKKNGVEQTAKAYSTTAEAGAEYIPNKIDGVNCYVATGDTTDSRATVGRVKKSSTAAERAILNSGKPPYNKIEWRTPGTYTFTFPAGVSTARITTGAAGGGGGGASTVSATGATGGNGGRGGLVTKTVSVGYLSTHQVIVGGGGAAGQQWYDWRYGTNGGAGGNSSFGNLVSAQGGGGGQRGEYTQNGDYLWGKNPVHGTSYGQGGTGGRGGIPQQDTAGNYATAGANGWIIIEYGGDI